MCPVPAQDDVADGGVTDTELLAESTLVLFASSVPCSDFEHLRGRKFDIAMPQPTRITTLRFRVLVIGEMRTQEEVIRSDADPVVACMADQKSVGHRAMEQVPTNAMGVKHAALMPTSSKGTVSIPERRSSPGPTRSGRIDFLPEALGK